MSTDPDISVEACENDAKWVEEIDTGRSRRGPTVAILIRALRAALTEAQDSASAFALLVADVRDAAGIATDAGGSLRERVASLRARVTELENDAFDKFVKLCFQRNEDRISTLEAENAALRKAIEDAPCGDRCDTLNNIPPPPCNCWKREAMKLGAEKG